MLRYTAVSMQDERKERKTLEKDEYWVKNKDVIKNALPYHLVNILVRQKFRKILSTHQIIVEAIGYKFATQLPICLPIKDKPTHIRVYINTKGFDYSILPAINNPKWITAPSSILLSKHFVEMWKADSANENTKKRWENIKRAKKAILKYEDMTISRMLTRYTELNKEFRADQIANMAQAIENDLKPVELIFTKGPEDFLTMYSSGPNSCMTNTRNEFKKLANDGISATALYHYIPNCKGAYIMRNGQVAARAILFGKHYGRMYSINQKMTETFERLLRSEGYTPIKGSYCVENVEVPGLWSKSLKDYVIHIPYFDNVSPVYWNAKFNIKTRTFTLFCKDGVRIGHNSTVCAKHLIQNRLCMTCSAAIRDGKQITVGTLVFCSHPCAKTAGYVEAYTGTGALHVVKEETAVQVYTETYGLCYYTNIEAAKRYTGGQNVKKYYYMPHQFMLEHSSAYAIDVSLGANMPTAWFNGEEIYYIPRALGTMFTVETNPETNRNEITRIADDFDNVDW